MALERDDVIRPDGLPGSYSTVQIKPGVTVIAMDDRRNVHLTSEFHYAVGRVTVVGLGPGDALHSARVGADCLRGLRRLGDALYAVGDGGTILRLELPAATPPRWQRLTTHTTQALWDIAAGPGGYLVAGWQRPLPGDRDGYKRGLLLGSSDGLDFAPLPQREPQNPIYSIALVRGADGPAFLLSGIGRALLRSTDGRTFTREASGALDALRNLPGKDLRFNVFAPPPGDHAFQIGRASCRERVSSPV